MDSSTLFNSDDASTAGSAATVSDNSAAINADELLGTTDDAATTTTTVTTPDPVADSNAPTGRIGDPLADADDSVAAPVPEEDDIVPNETITTNDWSKVGEVKPKESPTDTTPYYTDTEAIPPQEGLEPEIVPAALPSPTPPPEIVPPLPPESAPEVEAPPFASELKFKAPGVNDPEKMSFIKTYTEEFDAAMMRATGAAQGILDAIDKAVHEHSPDITVPDAADEFLARKPTNNKVEKFEDAREIVNEVLDRAADAKAQAAKAAEEAARIYEEVQAFKRETEMKIISLTTDQQQVA